MSFSIKVFPSLIFFFIIILFENFCCTTNAIEFKKENLDISENNDKQILRNNKGFKRNNYDEYPMVVPKRAALLLDRLMIALQNVLEGDRNQIKSFNGYYGNGNNNFFGQHRQKTFQIRPRIVIKDLPINFGLENGQYGIYTPGNTNYKNLPELKSDNFDMDLMAKSFQRRAHEEESFGGQISQIYWRCYFNAITCF